MKAGIFYTGSGPVLILTSYESLDEPRLVEKLQHKGITKYMAFEVPLELVKQRYGQHYKTVMNDLKQEDDLRVLDFDGRHVFQCFSFKEMGQSTNYEE